MKISELFEGENSSLAKTFRRTRYEDMCYKCGKKKYKIKHKLFGYTVGMGKCPKCKKDNVGIVYACDWESMEQGDNSFTWD